MPLNSGPVTEATVPIRRVTAIITELEAQRSMANTRCTELAAAFADVAAERDALKTRVATLEEQASAALADADADTSRPRYALPDGLVFDVGPILQTKADAEKI